MIRPLRCLLVLLIVLLPTGLFATTFPVTKTADTDDGTCDPDCSLREAIDAANTNPGADDVPVPAGTYLLTLGQLTVSDHVSIAGAGQTSTIIDGNATDRVFDIGPRIPFLVVEISGITIQNGYAVGVGGGISNIRSYLSLIDSTVRDNSAAGRGGGIEARGGLLTLTNSTVSGNTAGTYGGGIYGDNLALTNSTVSGNTAVREGGGVDNHSGNTTLTNSTVSDNTPLGVYSRGYLTLINSTVSGNTAGIRGYSASITNSTVSGNTGLGIEGGDFLTLTNSTVSENAGGIRMSHGSLTLTNSTVSGNTGYWDAIYALRVTLTNSTVSGNTGAGIAVNQFGGLTLINSTVSGNAVGVWWSCPLDCQDYPEPYSFAENSIVTDSGWNNCKWSIGPPNHNLSDDTSCGFIVADAMLGPLQDNGGPTETHDLLDGSPAIDAGSIACPPPDTDQRGVARPQGAACDIGAVEFVPEPGGSAMLVGGIGLLGLLYRRCARDCGSVSGCAARQETIG